MPVSNPHPETDYDEQGHPIVGSFPRQLTDVIVSSHDFTDPTTWYEQSQRVTAQAASDSGDGLVWNLPDQNLIDMTHGKIRGENAIVAAHASHGYAIEVRVNSVPVTERTPFAVSGGDYVVDYEAGTITFAASQAGSAVEVDYSKAAGSTFTLKPLAGKILFVEGSQVHMSADIDPQDSIVFEIYGYAADFDPEGVTNGTYQPTDLISVVREVYKTIDQVVDDIDRPQPVIKALGSTSPRGFTQDRHCLSFRYSNSRALESAKGMELRMSLESDQPFGGERMTTSFFCTSIAETP